MRRASFLIAAVTLAAGCGGKSGLSKKQYLQRGNAICASYTGEINQVAARSPRNLTEGRTLLKQTARLVRKENDEIRSLDPPRALRDDVRRMVAARDRLLEVFNENLETIAQATQASLNGDPSAQKKVQRLQAVLGPLTTRARELTNKVGLKTCAREFRG